MLDRTFAASCMLAPLSLLLACSGGDERSEARAFIAVYNQIDYGAPPAARAAKLVELERVPLSSEELRSVRDGCMRGHRQLIDAQQSQDATAAEIDKALSAAPGGQPLAPDTIARLQARLETSKADLGRARTQLEACEDSVRSLDLRFGRR